MQLHATREQIRQIRVKNYRNKLHCVMIPFLAKERKIHDDAEAVVI